MVDLAPVAQLEDPLVAGRIEWPQPVLDQGRPLGIGVALVDPVERRVGRIGQAFDLESRRPVEDPQVAVKHEPRSAASFSNSSAGSMIRVRDTDLVGRRVERDA